MVSFLTLILMAVGTLVGSIGALRIKKGSNLISGRENRLFQMLKSRHLWTGFIFYGFSTIFYVIALRLEQLSVIYPLASLTYLWVTFLSIKFLGEKMSRWKWLAISGIILGVVLVGFGGS